MKTGKKENPKEDQPNENVKVTRQLADQDQQQKLQHQHDIDQVIVKPMPDDLQKRINLLGNRK